MILIRHSEKKTIVAVQEGDHMLVGFAGAGLYGEHEDCSLITLASPDGSNEIELAIPKRALDALLKAMHTAGRYEVKPKEADSSAT